MAGPPSQRTRQMEKGFTNTLYKRLLEAEALEKKKKKELKKEKKEKLAAMPSLCFALLCILFISLTLSHHVVFEEIGEMAFMPMSQSTSPGWPTLSKTSAMTSKLFRSSTQRKDNQQDPIMMTGFISELWIYSS